MILGRTEGDRQAASWRVIGMERGADARDGQVGEPLSCPGASAGGRRRSAQSHRPRPRPRFRHRQAHDGGGIDRGARVGDRLRRAVLVSHRHAAGLFGEHDRAAGPAVAEAFTSTPPMRPEPRPITMSTVTGSPSSVQPAWELGHGSRPLHACRSGGDRGSLSRSMHCERLDRPEGPGEVSYRCVRTGSVTVRKRSSRS